MSATEFELPYSGQQLVDKLNKIDILEEAIETKLDTMHICVYFNLDDNNHYCDTSFNEIYTHINNGGSVILNYKETDYDRYFYSVYFDTEEIDFIEIDDAGSLTCIKIYSDEILVTTFDPVYRDYESGNLSSNEPLNYNDVTTKSYVDNSIKNNTGIIDVIELPTENIKENVFYRLLKANFVLDREIRPNNISKCYCVDSLPNEESRIPYLDSETGVVTGYYTTDENTVRGYVNSELSTELKLPSGWHPFSSLYRDTIPTWGGIITDITECSSEDTLCVLLSYDLYMYKNEEWIKIIASYERTSKLDITWDGNIGDRFNFDVGAINGEPESTGINFVKVSDLTPSSKEIIDGKISYCPDGSNLQTFTITEDIISTLDGGYTISDFVVVVYNKSEFNSALGLTEGYIKNGIYFIHASTEEMSGFVSKFVGGPRITKINGKYIDGFDYNDLINQPGVIRYDEDQNLSSAYKRIARNNIDVYSRTEVDNKVSSINLSEYAKTTDLSEYAKTTDVENMIAQAILLKIGGKY